MAKHKEWEKQGELYWRKIPISTEGKYQSFDIKKETMPTSKSESYHKYIEHFLNAASYIFFILIYLKIKHESMKGVR